MWHARHSTDQLLVPLKEEGSGRSLLSLELAQICRATSFCLEGTSLPVGWGLRGAFGVRLGSNSALQSSGCPLAGALSLCSMPALHYCWRGDAVKNHLPHAARVAQCKREGSPLRQGPSYCPPGLSWLQQLQLPSVCLSSA